MNHLYTRGLRISRVVASNGNPGPGLAALVSAVLLLIGGTGCSPPPVAVVPPEVDQSRLDRFQITLLQEARQKVIQSPQSAQAWGQLGQQYNALDYFPEAIICYRQAILKDDSAGRWYHLLGLLQLQDHPEEAMKNLTRAIERVGTETDAPRLRLIQALVELGRFDQAQPHLQFLLNSQPNHAAARLEMARIRLAESNPRQASELLSVCLTNRHTARPSLLLLSQIKHLQGEPEAALSLSKQATRMPRPFDWPDPYLREVQSLSADRQKLQDHINALLMQKRIPEAEKALANLMNLFPGDAEGLLLLGRLRFQERRCEEAEAAFRQHLQVNPNSLNGLIQLSLSLLCQQRWADAVPVLDQALKIKPDFAEAHYNLGYAQARNGQADSAIASFKDTLRCRPGHVNAHVSLAEEYLKRSQNTEARLHIDRALALSPSHPKAKRMDEILSRPQ